MRGPLMSGLPLSELVGRGTLRRAAGADIGRGGEGRGRCGADQSCTDRD